MSKSTSNSRTCPYCCEDIQVSAIKCKHCKSSLNIDPTPARIPPKTQQSLRFVHPTAMNEEHARGKSHGIIALFITFIFWVITMNLTDADVVDLSVHLLTSLALITAYASWIINITERITAPAGITLVYPCC